jgi:ankyrin repeat protein
MCKATALFLIASACYRQPGLPLTQAARNGDTRSIHALAKQGADVNAADGVNSWTPLEHAIHKHQVESVKALLDAGADPNLTDPRGVTPLMMAAGYGYTDIVTILLKRGADMKLRDRDGATALDFAITGVSDIDRFTLFDCQSSTIHALESAGAPAGTQKRAASLKKC